ncbi:MAG: hypothetical protein P4L84_11280 [Isosphaeraceae bacterium]|nr:hypothetical protein [Isosphaeraceae bacterium]
MFLRIGSFLINLEFVEDIQLFAKFTLAGAEGTETISVIAVQTRGGGLKRYPVPTGEETRWASAIRNQLNEHDLISRSSSAFDSSHPDADKQLSAAAS